MSSLFAMVPRVKADVLNETILLVYYMKKADTKLRQKIDLILIYLKFKPQDL